MFKSLWSHIRLIPALMLHIGRHGPMWVVKVLLYVTVGLSIVMMMTIVWQRNWSQEAEEAHVRAIYQQIIVSTGQTQDALPLIIDSSLVDNAFNDGTKVVIYQGLINHTKTWDEVAMVLAHEVSHGNLGHLGAVPPYHQHIGDGSNDNTAELEANADKLGAFYMMKAGYDICKGRQLFKYWKDRNGNALGQNHPDYSYRYDELNVNCGE